MISNIFKKSSKIFKNVKNKKKIIYPSLKDNKEPPFNISIMDLDFSEKFWKMNEKNIKLKKTK